MTLTIATTSLAKASCSICGLSSASVCASMISPRVLPLSFTPCSTLAARACRRTVVCECSRIVAELGCSTALTSQ
eukprot:2887-Heterococcus_DN1.PRE.2